MRPHRVNIANQLIAPQAALTESEGAEHPKLYRFLQGLGETTGGIQLVLSTVVLFGIVFASRRPLAERPRFEKTVLHTAFVLAGTLAAVVGFFVASRLTATSPSTRSQPVTSPVASPEAHVIPAAPVPTGTIFDDVEAQNPQAKQEPEPFATLPTLANLKAQMKEDNPSMSLREFKRMRAATGLSHIWELHKDSFKPVSALYLADGTVCYQYFFAADNKRTMEYGVLTTDGSLYVNALDTALWKQLCEGEKGDEMVETPH